MGVPRIGQSIFAIPLAIPSRTQGGLAGPVLCVRGVVGPAAAEASVGTERLYPTPPQHAPHSSNWPEVGHMAAPAAREPRAPSIL